MRLRRSDCRAAGIARRRHGRGFAYRHADGRRVTDERLLERIEALVVPPAWKDVWICPEPNGHIQATGVDEAGRRQYRYHDEWVRRRAGRKFEAMLEFAAALPRLRRAVARDLGSGRADRAAALACAVRLIDLGGFRIGGEQYADEHGTFGVATILRSQVSLPRGGDAVEFDYPSKGAQRRRVTIRDRPVRELAARLLRRRSGPEDFLVYRRGRRWVDVRSEDVNEYIQDRTDERFSAKGFRTWQGTVIAAIHLARAGPPPASKRGRERRIKEAVAAAAEALGNTAAVARRSYVDPRLLDRYRDGIVIAAGAARPRPARTGLSAAEREVLALLGG